MRKLHGRQANDGDKRIIHKRFLLLPRNLMNQRFGVYETRWLESASWEEQYLMGLGWTPMRWVNE